MPPHSHICVKFWKNSKGLKLGYTWEWDTVIFKNFIITLNFTHFQFMWNSFSGSWNLFFNFRLKMILILIGDDIKAYRSIQLTCNCKVMPSVPCCTLVHIFSFLCLYFFLRGFKPVERVLICQNLITCSLVGFYSS